MQCQVGQGRVRRVDVSRNGRRMLQTLQQWGLCQWAASAAATMYPTVMDVYNCLAQSLGPVGGVAKTSKFFCY